MKISFNICLNISLRHTVPGLDIISLELELNIHYFHTVSMSILCQVDIKMNLEFSPIYDLISAFVSLICSYVLIN